MTTFILLGVAAVLLLTLSEIIADRKCMQWIRDDQEARYQRLLNENHALENKAQEMVRNFENEC